MESLPASEEASMGTVTTDETVLVDCALWSNNA